MFVMRCLLLSALLAVASFTPEANAAGVAVTSPQPNSAVNRTFNLTGTATPRAAIALTIDGKAYILPSERGRTVGEGVGPGQADERGRFSIEIDLNGGLVVNDLSGPTVISSGVADGQHTFGLQELFDGQAGLPGSAQITLTVTSGEAAPDQSNPGATSLSSSPEAALAVTAPIASATPAAEVKIKNSRALSPLLGLLGLTLLGMAAVVVAHRLSPRR